MNKNILGKNFFLLTVTVIITFNNIVSAGENQKNISENNNLSKANFFNNSKINYYSENEIRNELKKAGINSKSIEAFITANNNAKNKNISTVKIEQIKKELLKAVKFDSKNYLALDALGEITAEEATGTHEEEIHYEKAIKANPEFEKAYGHLLWEYSIREENIFREKKKDLAEKTIALFPQYPEGHKALYEYYSYYEKDYDKAILSGEKALELYFKKEAKYYGYERLFRDEKSYSDLGNEFAFSLFETYLKKGNDRETFDFFFKRYENMKKANDKLIQNFSVSEFSSDEEEFKKIRKTLTDTVENIKNLNEKYKHTDKKLYEENMKKLKALKL